jgi:BirA family biotin operon repressor/biotin-[acetyl-CoA-carboxylase] ligase
MQTNYQHFETIDSTNNWGKLNCHTFDVNKITLITADSQTAGRGRFKREWVSPPHENIYATFGFAIDKTRLDIGNIPQILAISTAKTLKKLKFNPQLKWPNDVLLSDKKVAGILCETVSFKSHFMVILGIGLNVNMPLTVLEKIDRPATSLIAESGICFEVKYVLELLENFFKEDLETFIKQGFKPFLSTYRELMWTSSSKKLRFHDNLNIVEGTFNSINDDGTLNLTLPSGVVKRFLSGEFLP